MNKTKIEQFLDTRLIDAGENWKASCPFHHEKTPSFFIHKSEYLCHCFGCGVAGYLDLLVAKKKGLSVDEVRQLLEIPAIKTGFTKEKNEPTPSHFPKSWLSVWPREISKYILDRNLELEVLKAAGARYDHNTQRQVFPVFNQQGKLLGATGRTTIKEDPKWFHYWNFDKSRQLYRIRTAKRTPLVLVEGVLDCLWLEQNGYHSAAILSAFLSDSQAKEVKEHSETVILALDRDEAGEKGTLRAVELLKRSCILYYASLPVFAKDVCDLSKEQLKSVIDNPLTVLQWRSHIKQSTTA